MKQINEFGLIKKIKKKISGSRVALVGIGDDAAVLKLTGSGKLVISTDMLVEGVDFILNGKDGVSHFLQKSDCPRSLASSVLCPEQIGRKALAVNLSDLAAMGAKPLAFVLSIGKPWYISEKWIDRFYNGLLKLARQHKVDCIGGDLSGAKELSVSLTVIGTVKKPVLRSGAKKGDWIAITGDLGGSILGHHFGFIPRVREGRVLSENCLVRSMIDVSDGLYQDLEHILTASTVGAEIELAKIPVSPAARRLHGKKALEGALTDGEDFELLFTASVAAKTKIEKLWRRQFPRVPLTWIGRIKSGRPVVRWMRDGQSVSLAHLKQKGFKHF